MSYVSSFVHAQQPTANIVVTETKTVNYTPAKSIVKKEATTKILLFVAIIACLALAVNI